MSLFLSNPMRLSLSNPASIRRSLSTSLRRLQQPSVDPQAAGQTKISANYNRPQVPKPAKHGATSSQLPVIPLVAIFFTGSFLFWSLSKSREGQGRSHYVLPPRDNKPRENPNLNLTEH